MKNTEALQVDVLDRLAFDPEVDSSEIAVTVTGEGVVTLKGRVPTYEQLHAAERAVRGVDRVAAVANDLVVRVVPRSGEMEDSAIAEAVAWAIRCAPDVPKDRVRVTVTNGWLTLEGRVEDADQSRATMDALREIPGVRGIRNRLAVEAPGPGTRSVPVPTV